MTYEHRCEAKEFYDRQSKQVATIDIMIVCPVCEAYKCGADDEVEKCERSLKQIASWLRYCPGVPNAAELSEEMMTKWAGKLRLG